METISKKAFASNLKTVGRIELTFVAVRSIDRFRFAEAGVPVV